MPSYKREIDCLDAMNEAIALLKRAGFELAHTAGNSETCYYRFPGLDGLVRVSTHPGGKKGPIGLGGVVAKLVYPHYKRSPPGMCRISEDGLYNGVAAAIGRYFLSAPKPSRYDGPRAEQRINDPMPRRPI